MSDWETDENDVFFEGDLIEVRTRSKEAKKDFGTIRGSALVSRGRTGVASFRMQLPDAQELEFNLNYVIVRTLFSADVARETRGNE